MVQASWARRANLGQPCQPRQPVGRGGPAGPGEARLAGPARGALGFLPVGVAQFAGEAAWAQ